MEILLEVGGFDMDGSEMIMIQVHIDFQNCDLGGGGMLSEFDRIVAVQVFKELGEAVETMKP